HQRHRVLAWIWLEQRDTPDLRGCRPRSRSSDQAARYMRRARAWTGEPCLWRSRPNAARSNSFAAGQELIKRHSVMNTHGIELFVMPVLGAVGDMRHQHRGDITDVDPGVARVVHFYRVDQAARFRCASQYSLIFAPPLVSTNSSRM